MENESGRVFQVELGKFEPVLSEEHT